MTDWTSLTADGCVWLTVVIPYRLTSGVVVGRTAHLQAGVALPVVSILGMGGLLCMVW